MIKRLIKHVDSLVLIVRKKNKSKEDIDKIADRVMDKYESVFKKLSKT